MPETIRAQIEVPQHVFNEVEAAVRQFLPARKQRDGKKFYATRGVLCGRKYLNEQIREIERYQGKQSDVRDAMRKVLDA